MCVFRNVLFRFSRSLKSGHEFVSCVLIETLNLHFDDIHFDDCTCSVLVIFISISLHSKEKWDSEISLAGLQEYLCLIWRNSLLDSSKAKGINQQQRSLFIINEGVNSYILRKRFVY